jgi:hypothetical protein
MQPPLPASPVSTGAQTLEVTSQSASGEQSEELAHCVPHAPVEVQRYGWQSLTVPSFAVEERRSSEQVATSGSHFPLLQTLPSAQCSGFAHDVRQPASSHRYGAHSCGAGAAQEPSPLQVETPT